MSLTLLLFFMVAVVGLGSGIVGYFLGRASADLGPSQRAEIAERDAFIDHLREVAWQHRDVSPELSTIVIDEITTRHAKLTRYDKDV